MSRSPDKPAALRLVIACVVGLTVGLLVVFGLHEITALFRTSGIWSVLLTIALTVTMLLVGVVVGKITEDVPAAYLLLAIVVITCEVSWYWWDYRSLNTTLAQAAVSAQMKESLTADQFLTSEVGSPGFWSYLKWSAAQGATIEDSPVPAGNRAAIVNWGKRLISLFWALVWAFIGLGKT